MLVDTIQVASNIDKWVYCSLMVSLMPVMPYNINGDKFHGIVAIRLIVG
jgi:hypothetical protein